MKLNPYLLIMLCVGTQLYADGSDLMTNNRETYQLAAQVAQLYLRYTYETGATNNSCSLKGSSICTILNRLSEKTKSFYKPARDDLRQLAKDTELAFRYFDFTGSADDRRIFVNSLINLLKATAPLLTDAENTACKALIENLLKKI